MAKCLVTGAAGFIGSHLSDRLVGEGHEVIGLDAFTDYYARTLKESNIAALRGNAQFTLIEDDLLTADLRSLLLGVDYVFHLAGQPGVRPSWGASFDIYVQNNIVATQRLLEAAKGLPLKKLVYASSSSVYGDAESHPTSEDVVPQPISPYGVTKLAAEHLVYLYCKNYGLPALAVRFFTVYGPRQRPDMAFSKFIRAAITGSPIEVFGDGEQTRDFTYVSDAVNGALLAASSSLVGEVLNIGGGSRIMVNSVLAALNEISPRGIAVNRVGVQAGDARHTGADVSKAKRCLGYQPKVLLRDGLRRQYVSLVECD